MIAKSKRSKKDSYQAVFFSIFLAFLALGVIGFLVFSNWKISQKRAELQQKIETLKREIQILEEKNQQLRAEIAQTKKESFWEGKIREQGFIRKGEEAVVVKPLLEEAREETRVETRSFEEKLVDKIKNLLARVIQR